MDDQSFLSGLVVWPGGVEPCHPPHVAATVADAASVREQMDWGPQLWRELHLQLCPTAEWLAGWETRIACGSCRENYYRIKAASPPRYNDWFPWTWETHNAVNAESGAKQFTFDAALRLWRPQSAWLQQPIITQCVAVTSIAPSADRVERQSFVLNNWKQFGLSITAVQASREVDHLTLQYPQVDRWLVRDAPGCPTQRINQMLTCSIVDDQPVLLLNADIEIYGDQSRWLSLISKRKNAIGIRHNYDSHPGDATIEEWGLDAFLVYPEQVNQLTKVKFSIGRPMWDYWLTVELERISDACEWIVEPFFFHRSHPVAWSQADCTAAREAYTSQFGTMDWTTWRNSRPR